MPTNWWVFVLTGGVLASLAMIVLAVALYRPRWRPKGRTELFLCAERRFHQRREWLEAKFLTLASQSGKPRGLHWVDCDFEDEVSFARDLNSGHLRALVGATIQFEALEGAGMEGVEAVQEQKAATVVFRLDGSQWESDGRAYFNLSPSQIIANYAHELELVDPVP